MPAYKDKSNNTWYVKFRYKDYTGTIKQKTKRGFKLKGDAVQWEHDFLALRQGNPSMPFSELQKDYLEDAKSNLKQISYETKKSRIKLWIEPYFNSQPVDSIDADAVRQWQNEINTATGKNGKPLSAGYKKNLVVELGSIFSFAVKYKHLPGNPVSIAGDRIGKKARRCDFWTLEQFKQFLETFPEHDIYYTAFMTLYWTGMRLGELLALTVADVQPDRIRINKTYHTINGKPVVTAPKTAKSNRDIHINPELSKLLEEHKQKLYKPHKADRLFPIGDTTLTIHFKAHAKAAELPEIRVHDLRHSHASLLINQGADALLVSERLGHEDVTTTLNTYSHLFQSKQTEIVDKLSDIWVE